MIKIVVFLVGFFSIKTVVDAGQFKTIEPHFEGLCNSIFGLEGPEDIIILDDGRTFISSDPRRKALSESLSLYSYEEKDINSNQGSIFYYDLNNQKLQNLTSHLDFEFHPHGISIYKSLDEKIYLNAVSHTSEGHYVVSFILDGNKLILKEKISDPLLVSPNDLVMINENQFYITNDHGSKKMRGKLIEDYLQLARSNVLFYDGLNFKICQNKLQYANGINISKDFKTLYVTESVGKKVTVYNRDTKSNDIHLIKTIDVNSGLDNVELDQDANLWIGSNPKMFDFVKHAKNKNYYSPSQVIMISSKDNKIKEVFLSDGSDLSGSSVAALYNNNLLIGAVFEDHFLHCVLD